MIGLVAVDKPKGPTSRQITGKISRLFGIKQAGHTGTLDPMATGVLPVMLGRACKLINFLPDKKAYIATMQFGIKTDSGDITGNIVSENSLIPQKETFEKALPMFVGEITQTPPVFSALKKDGKPLYEYARKGIAVEVPSRTVRIDSIRLIDFADNKATIEVYCGGGTYIRTLCEDIAEKCGALAAMTDLRRIMDCGVPIESCHTVEEIENASDLSELILSPQEIFSNLNKVILPENGEKYYLNGGSISVKRLCGETAAGRVLVYTKGNYFAGLGEIKDDMLSPLWINTEE